MKIFLSHSSRDKALVREIHSYLPTYLSTWMDERDLLPGLDMAGSLKRVIEEEADIVVAFLSEKSVSSEWVKNELRWAIDSENRTGHPLVIPVLLDKVLHLVKPVQLRQEVERRLYLECFDQHETRVRAFAGELSDKIIRWIIKHKPSTNVEPGPRDPLTPDVVAQLIRSADSMLATRNYAACEAILKKLQNGGAGSAEVLWLQHLLYFERACLEENGNNAAEYKKMSMSYYREAVLLAPNRELFPKDDYEIAEPLGFGGLSHVYLARKDGQAYAAKSIREELIANFYMARQHIDALPIIADMTNAAQASPGVGIARIVEFNATEEKIVIVYEFVSGTSLGYQLWRITPEQLAQPSHYSRCLCMLEKVCDSLAFAHQRGILHLDISPNNILIVGNDDVWDEESPIKIIDFDTSRLAVGAWGASLTNILVAGTAQYMDPQFLKHPNANCAADESSDLYSVGMIAKTMFCGRTNTVKNPSDVSPLVSPVLDEIIATATEDERAKRFRRADDLKACLSYVRQIPNGALSLRARNIVKLTLFLVSIVYIGSLSPEFISGFGNGLWVTLAPVIGILCIMPIIYIAITHGFLMIDSVLRKKRQYFLTTVLLCVWGICGIVLRFQPELYLLILGVSLISAAMRFACYRNPMIQIGAMKAWAISRDAAFFDMLGAALCIGGFVSTKLMAIQWAPILTMSYNVVAAFFTALTLSRYRRDWQVQFASLSRALGWRNITGE